MVDKRTKPPDPLARIQDRVAFAKVPSEEVRGAVRDQLAQVSRVRKDVLNVAVKRIRDLRDSLRDDFYGRDEAIDMLLAATMAGVPLVFFGPPGTAKSRLVRQLSYRLGVLQGPSPEPSGARPYFEYLLTQHTMPEEIFGPPDIGVLTKQSRFRRRTEGMLPTAQLVFLDEIFRGSSQILNTLLTIINERKFHDGAETLDVPLLTVIGAANDSPHRNAELRALYDRFPVRVWLESAVDGVGGRAVTQMEALLDKSRGLRRMEGSNGVSRPGGGAGPDVKACINDFWLVRSCLELEGWEDTDSHAKRKFLETFLLLRGNSFCPLSDRSVYSLSRVARAIALLEGGDPDDPEAHLRVFRFVAESREGADEVHRRLSAILRGHQQTSRH